MSGSSLTTSQINLITLNEQESIRKMITDGKFILIWSSIFVSLRDSDIDRVFHPHAIDTIEDDIIRDFNC